MTFFFQHRAGSPSDKSFERALQQCARSIFLFLLCAATLSAVASAGSVLKSGDIVVRGHVVDELGRPLSGVRCAISEVAMGGDSGHVTGTTQRVDPDFEIRATDVLRIDLVFFAPNFEYLEDSFEIARPTSDVKIVDGVHQYDRTFVMIEARPVVSLFKTSMKLQVFRDGRRAMFRADGIDTDPELDSLAGKRGIEDTTTTLAVAYPYLYANLRAEKGHDPVLLIYNDREDYQVTPRDQVAQLCLANGDPGDGFIFYPMQAKDYYTRFFPRNMTTAPEEGYKRAIDVPAELFLATDIHPNRMFFFYVRLKGKFGKGRGIVSYNAKEETLTIRLALYLQPDGGRNIRSVDDSY